MLEVPPKSTREVTLRGSPGGAPALWDTPPGLRGSMVRIERAMSGESQRPREESPTQAPESRLRGAATTSASILRMEAAQAE